MSAFRQVVDKEMGFDLREGKRKGERGRGREEGKKEARGRGREEGKKEAASHLLHDVVHELSMAHQDDGIVFPTYLPPSLPPSFSCRAVRGKA